VRPVYFLRLFGDESINVCYYKRTAPKKLSNLSALVCRYWGLPSKMQHFCDRERRYDNLEFSIFGLP
jgi:hypothetical protein